MWLGAAVPWRLVVHGLIHRADQYAVPTICQAQRTRQVTIQTQP